MSSLPPPQPPVIGPPPPLGGGAPPPLLSPEPPRKSEVLRPFLAFLLSLCVGLLLVDGIVSLADDSLMLVVDTHVLTAVRATVWGLAVLVAFVIYGLMALTPMIPKQVFLPVTLFSPLATLVLIPLGIYFYGRLGQIAWFISLCQVIFGLGIIGWLQGGFRLRWPLVPESWLGPRRFSWLNLCGFVLVHLLVVLPAVVIYLALCAALAVGHFSAGFLELHRDGLTVQARQYSRNDGKTIRLVPMAHVGEAAFYRTLSRSFPSNAVVLMEGVTDNSNLLTNRITYRRMATSLGLSEQREEFHPVQVDIVMADVDVEQLTPDTIGFLNLAMLLHSKGLTAETVLKLMRFSPPPHLEERLMDDLLRKRNQHLLEQIRAQLSKSEHLVVPWGVAHMPGIEEGIQASGFRLAETREYTVIRFRAPRKVSK